MTSKFQTILAIALGFFGLYTIGVILAGQFTFASHEADMVHLVELLLRMAAGGVPHLDFMTPIGGWAMQPMVVLSHLGLGVGSSLLWSQLIVLAIFYPVVIWIGVTRLTLGQSVALLAVVGAITTALVFGGDEPLISFSMHYNRWCWAATILVVTMTCLTPSGTRSGAVDGVLIGLLMVAMAMTKVTFALGLTLPVVFALLRNGRSATVGIALATATIALLLITLLTGFNYWLAYAGDLLAVIHSENRPMPSASFPELILSPRATPITLMVLFSIWTLRRTGQGGMGTTLMLFFPALVFVQWQNFGNDPVWLLAWALILWAMSERAEEARLPLRAAALSAAVLIAPVLFNMLSSPVRHMALTGAETRPLLAQSPDLRMITLRGQGAWVKQTAIPLPDTTPTQFDGTTLPECELTGGLIATLERDAAALIALDPAMDRQPLVADLFSPHWMFADLRPLTGGTPWYYDGLPGLTDATHLMVPNCPADAGARAHILSLITAQGVGLTPAGATADFALYRISR